MTTDTQWKQQAKELLDQKELEECTFKPKIGNYESNKSQTRGGDKCVELYMRAKAGKDKKDKTKDEYEYEKGKEECTFQPNIQKSEIM